jgi:hypothetical protein
VFCGTAGRLTEEHIFGDWLRKLGYDGDGVREIGDPPIIQRGGAFSKKLKIACASCNNGWMSKLENDAKPLLVALFNAGGRSVPLEAAAQRTLARWAFKTAVVGAYADKTQVDPFPQDHRREFYEKDEPPQQVQVRIGAATIPTILSKGEYVGGYLFEPSLATVTLGGESTSFPFYRVQFRLLTVAFDIIGWVTADVTLEGGPNKKLRPALLQLWPTQHPTIWWPPVTSLDAFGGSPGLTAGKVIGIPTILPNKPT